jgi:ribonucleoside-diphosphate reductase alpha chain
MMEQPLPPFGACLLGSFNLTKYIFDGGGKQGWMFDWEQFNKDIPVVVRAMDNVVDRAIYPLYEQEKEAKSKRRMGLGITGAANAIEALGTRYGDDDFVFLLDQIMEALATECYRASIDLAKEKGAFPLFDADQFVQSKYLQGEKWEDIRTDIYIHGIRNSHLISIAPTGTISMTADNVSSGIEPVFSYSMDRAVQTPDGQINVKLEDYGYANFGVEGKRTDDVTVDEHLRVLSVGARWSDSAVSKTCNVPADTSWVDFKDLYVRAWRMGAKGVTTYTTGGKRAPILKSEDKEEQAACYLDPVTGRKECE